MERKAIFLFEITDGTALFSVANANSNDSEFNCNSNSADNSNSNNRFRLALVLRAFCFFKPLADFFADGNHDFKMRRIPTVGNKFLVDGNMQ